MTHGSPKAIRSRMLLPAAYSKLVHYRLQDRMQEPVLSCLLRVECRLRRRLPNLKLPVLMVVV